MKARQYRVVRSSMIAQTEDSAVTLLTALWRMRRAMLSLGTIVSNDPKKPAAKRVAQDGIHVAA